MEEEKGVAIVLPRSMLTELRLIEYDDNWVIRVQSVDAGVCTGLLRRDLPSPLQ